MGFVLAFDLTCESVLVAIDFGTAFSGYAFCFVRDPGSIHVMRRWEGGDPGINNQKTPSCLLLDPNGGFHSFGYAARDYFHDLESQEAKKWMYFDKFKMTLYNNLVRNMLRHVCCVTIRFEMHYCFLRIFELINKTIRFKSLHAPASKLWS